MATAHVNGTDLFYETHGVGRPVLVMHGGLGLDHTYLRPWFDPLGERAQLVYYDHRCNGRSARPASLDDVDHATWVADADALRAHLGHDKVVLIGHSYGGFLALEYALRHPDRLAGLVLCNSAPAFDYAPVAMQNAQARATPEQLASLQVAFSRPFADDAAFAASWRTVRPVYFRRWNEEWGTAMDRKARYSAAAFNASMLRCIAGYDVRARLGEIRVPTLVVSGRHDWVTPAEQGGARLHAGIPGSRFVVFEESGHCPFIEEQRQFVDLVGDWLRELA